MSGIQISPLSCIICDEVRTEDNGKSLLIGVYGQNIEVATFPAILSIQCYVAARIFGLGNTKIHFQFGLSSQAAGEFTETNSGGLEISSDEDADGTETFIALPTPPITFTVEEAGQFVVKWSLDGEDWKKLYSVMVTCQKK